MDSHDGVGDGGRVTVDAWCLAMKEAMILGTCEYEVFMNFFCRLCVGDCMCRPRRLMHSSSAGSVKLLGSEQ